MSNSNISASYKPRSIVIRCLLKEVNHRVKNSLQIVSSMLQLQANAASDPALTERLTEASSRVNAVGRAYDHLAYNADYENIDLVAYLRDVTDDTRTAVAPFTIQFEASEKIQFAAARAILVGLIINELVSNAAKYAYPNRSDGSIWVRVSRADKDAVFVSVRDDGVGLPAGFDPTTSKRLGSRLVSALSRQLGAEMTRPVSPIGANITLMVPLTVAAT